MAVTFIATEEGDDGVAVFLTEQDYYRTFLDNKDGEEIDRRLDELEENGGAAGENGITPHIGLNGNWFIGETDTGMPSRGEQGKDGIGVERISIKEI